MAASRSKVLSLYRVMLREGEKFTDYNYRHYAVRRVRDAFKESKNVTDPAEIEKLLAYGKENLDIIKRQVLVGSLYTIPPLVIEENPTANIEDLNREIAR